MFRPKLMLPVSLLLATSVCVCISTDATTTPTTPTTPPVFHPGNVSISLRSISACGVVFKWRWDLASPSEEESIDLFMRIWPEDSKSENKDSAIEVEVDVTSFIFSMPPIATGLTLEEPYQAQLVLRQSTNGTASISGESVSQMLYFTIPSIPEPDELSIEVVSDSNPPQVNVTWDFPMDCSSDNSGAQIEFEVRQPTDTSAGVRVANTFLVIKEGLKPCQTLSVFVEPIVDGFKGPWITKQLTLPVAGPETEKVKDVNIMNVTSESLSISWSPIPTPKLVECDESTGTTPVLQYSVGCSSVEDDSAEHILDDSVQERIVTTSDSQAIVPSPYSVSGLLRCTVTPMVNGKLVEESMGLLDVRAPALPYPLGKVVITEITNNGFTVSMKRPFENITSHLDLELEMKRLDEKETIINHPFFENEDVLSTRTSGLPSWSQWRVRIRGKRFLTHYISDWSKDFQLVADPPRDPVLELLHYDQTKKIIEIHWATGYGRDNNPAEYSARVHHMKPECTCDKCYNFTDINVPLKLAKQGAKPKDRQLSKITFDDACLQYQARYQVSIVAWTESSNKKAESSSEMFEVGGRTPRIPKVTASCAKHSAVVRWNFPNRTTYDGEIKAFTAKQTYTTSRRAPWKTIRTTDNQIRFANLRRDQSVKFQVWAETTEGKGPVATASCYTSTRYTNKGRFGTSIVLVTTFTLIAIGLALTCSMFRKSSKDKRSNQQYTPVQQGDINLPLYL